MAARGIGGRAEEGRLGGAARSEAWRRLARLVLQRRFELPAWKGTRADAALPARPGNNFDALRLIAALLVVFGHQAMISGRDDGTGTVGMRLLMFFAISGFLVTGSWHSDPHPVRFLARRFLRLWPAFAAMVVVCAVGAYVWAPSNLHRLAAWFYLNNLRFWGFDWTFFEGPWPTLNQSMWMVPYEVNLYLALALAAVLGRWVLHVAVAVVLLSAVGSVEPTTTGGGLFEAWSPYFAGFFAAGVLLREAPRLRSGVAVLVGLAVGGVLLAVGERTLGLLFVIPPCAVWIGLQSWPVFRSAARFGDLSLGIFLWGWPVQQATRQWMGVDAPLAVQLAVVLPQILLLAWLSWRFVEKPAMRLKPTVRSAAAPAGPDASTCQGAWADTVLVEGRRAEAAPRWWRRLSHRPASQAPILGG